MGAGQLQQLGWAAAGLCRGFSVAHHEKTFQVFIMDFMMDPSIIS